MSHQLRNKDQQPTSLRPSFDEEVDEVDAMARNSGGREVFDVNKALENLRADPWSMLSEISDIILVVDKHGMVTRSMCHQDLAFADVVAQWHGHRLAEILTPESRVKFDAKIAKIPHVAKQNDAATGMSSTFGNIELNHLSPSNGQEYPVQYSLHFLKHDHGFALFGRDLSIVSSMQKQLVDAHLSLEQEREQQEQYLAKQHLIMESLLEPAFFVDASNGQLLEYNQKAAKLFNIPSTLSAPDINTFLGGIGSKHALAQLLEASSGKGTGQTELAVKTKHQMMPAEVNIFRTAGKRTLFVKLLSNIPEPGQESKNAQLRSFVDKLPDGVAFFNREGMVTSCNDAFLDLTGIGHDIAKANFSVANILSRGQVELNILLDQAAKSGAVSSYATNIRTVYGAQRDVLISMVPLGSGKNRLMGLVLRTNDPTAKTTWPNVPPQQDVSEDEMQTMIGLVGNMALKDIVAKSADVIEKVCIEAALKMTNNNRMAASELLGLSRQSLYVKLRKFGLLNREV